MRIRLVYDHLYPQTVGGAERWMRDLALGLAAAGHDVTYLTMRHWPDGDAPVLTGVRVVGLTHPGRVYRESRRAPSARPSASASPSPATSPGTVGSTTSSTPRRSRISRSSPPGVAPAARRYQLVVDWHEVWTRGYWRRYAGRIAGTIGWRGAACVHPCSAHGVLHVADALRAPGCGGVPRHTLTRGHGGSTRGRWNRRPSGP